MYCYDLNELCEHADMLKLPYSGELCKSCNSIIIDDDFDKHLTRQNFDDIMRVLAKNYCGDIMKNPKWYNTYKFVNVNELRKPRDVRSSSECKHLKKEEIGGTFFCTTCGEELHQTFKQLGDPSIYADCYTLRTNPNRTSIFQKTINEFQGKCEYEDLKKIPQKLYEDLDSIFPNKECTKCDIKNTLKKLKFNKHIKCVHHIHHIFTGVPKNDISEYENRLIEDYNYLYDIYKHKKKIPFNYQLILCVLLESYDCVFDRSEFSIPKNAKEDELVALI